jgi:hypothetical protein
MAGFPGGLLEIPHLSAVVPRTEEVDVIDVAFSLGRLLFRNVAHAQIIVSARPEVAVDYATRFARAAS